MNVNGCSPKQNGSRFGTPTGNFMPPVPMFQNPTFDPYLCEEHFPRRSDVDPEENRILQSIIARHAELTPNAGEQAAISNLVEKVKDIFDALILNPGIFPDVEIEEVRDVGSFKKETMLTKNNVADLVVILKTLPTVEAVSTLGNKIVDELKAVEPKEIFGCVTRIYGCEIAGLQAVVRLLITILPQYAHQLEPDLHLPKKILQDNMATIRHARWFEENAVQHSTIKVLVRILKDMKRRFVELSGLSIWNIELLAHYCVVGTRNSTPLSLSQAFKRFFMLLSSGFLLPKSPALVDPCDPATRIHFKISNEDMDRITRTSQTLYRAILHGGIDTVLGLVSPPHGKDICEDDCKWEDGVKTEPKTQPLVYFEGCMDPIYVDSDEEVSEDSQETGTAKNTSQNEAEEAIYVIS